MGRAWLTGNVCVVNRIVSNLCSRLVVGFVLRRVALANFGHDSEASVEPGRACADDSVVA